MSQETKCPFPLRADLETLPPRMLHLPVDSRGYVVPWFVEWIDGKPEFRCLDPRKWVEAVRFKKCWVCGNRMGRWMTFLAGPLCGINRTSSEPPCHLECAKWSARNCPFLKNPDQVRRTDEVIHSQLLSVGGVAITRNPRVSMLWTTDTYTIFDDGKGGKLINMGEPNQVEWWTRGRAATREEVLHSIETGLPVLAALAQQQKGAMDYLMECRGKLNKYVPAE